MQRSSSSCCLLCSFCIVLIRAFVTSCSRCVLATNCFSLSNSSFNMVLFAVTDFSRAMQRSSSSCCLLCSRRTSTFSSRTSSCFFVSPLIVAVWSANLLIVKSLSSFDSRSWLRKSSFAASCFVVISLIVTLCCICKCTTSSIVVWYSSCNVLIATACNSRSFTSSFSWFVTRFLLLASRSIILCVVLIFACSKLSSCSRKPSISKICFCTSCWDNSFSLVSSAKTDTCCDIISCCCVLWTDTTSASVLLCFSSFISTIFAWRFCNVLNFFSTSSTFLLHSSPFSCIIFMCWSCCSWRSLFSFLQFVCRRSNSLFCCFLKTFNKLTAMMCFFFVFSCICCSSSNWTPMAVHFALLFSKASFILLCAFCSSDKDCNAFFLISSALDKMPAVPELWANIAS